MWTDVLVNSSCDTNKRLFVDFVSCVSVDNFSALNTPIYRNVWRQRSARVRWGVDSAPPYPLAGYRGYPPAKERREVDLKGMRRLGWVGLGREDGEAGVVQF